MSIEEEKRVGHSESEINTGVIFKFLAGLTLFAILVVFVIWGIFRFFQNQAAKSDPQVSPLARDVSQQPPLPRLQVSPVLDLQRVRANEEQLLMTYGWVDQKNGIVRIPVREAMKLAIQKNLFSVSTTGAQTKPSSETGTSQ